MRLRRVIGQQTMNFQGLRLRKWTSTKISKENVFSGAAAFEVSEKGYNHWTEPHI
jgi:hypothetical protein